MFISAPSDAEKSIHRRFASCGGRDLYRRLYADEGAVRNDSARQSQEFCSESTYKRQRSNQYAKRSLSKALQVGNSGIVITIQSNIVFQSCTKNLLTSGDELLSVKAYDAINDQLEFICYRPELVFCLTDFISSGNYQLRVVYSSEQKPFDFELPIAIIVRHSLSDSSPIESIYEVSFHRSFCSLILL